MTRFRPCIDLHAGQVKQIVGGTLTDVRNNLKTNFVSAHPAEHFARLYRDSALQGGHVIMLGPGNDVAAKETLRTWPGRLQIGGGITDQNACDWIDAGAEKVSQSNPRHCFPWPVSFRYLLKQYLVVDESCQIPSSFVVSVPVEQSS